jgi:hypothetical protein
VLKVTAPGFVSAMVGYSGDGTTPGGRPKRLQSDSPIRADGGANRDVDAEDADPSAEVARG